MYKYRHKNRLLANLYDRSSPRPPVPLSIRTLPVARGHWALYSDAADAGKAQHTQTHAHRRRL